MKKFILLLTLIFTCTTLLSTFVAAENGPIRVVVDGKKVYFPDAQPYLDATARTQVPSRFIAEALGATTTWNQEKKQATFEVGTTKLVLTIGMKDYLLNGKKKTMDTAAVVKDNRTYVPARYVAEAFGAKVTWDKAVNTVYIQTNGNTTPIPTPKPEDGKTTYHDGISFNTVTDVDQYNRMSAAKAKEFLMKLAEQITFVKENGKYVIKATYPEIPQAYYWSLGILVSTKDGKEKVYNGVDDRAEFQIPIKGSFTKVTTYTSKENIDMYSVIIAISPKDVSKLSDVMDTELGTLQVIRSSTGDRATFVPNGNSKDRETYEDFDFTNMFKW